MPQAFPVLLLLLLCRWLAAVRPQEVLRQDQPSIHSSRHHKLGGTQAAGGAEVLAVGHSAVLQRDRGRKRLQHSSPPAAAEVALAEVATSPSGPVAPPPQHHPEPSPTLRDLPSDPVVETGPLAQLLGEAQAAPAPVEHDSTEAGKEMDEAINDGLAAWGAFVRVVRPLAVFLSDEVCRHVVLNVFIYSAAVFIALGLYIMWFQHREVPAEQDFRYGICDCLGDSRVCFCGFLCPAMRWADTVSEGKGSFLSFVTAFVFVQLAILVAVGMTAMSPWAGSCAWLGMIVTGVHYRQKIREKYGLESDTLPSYIEDFFAWCCCAGCALCQEARQVDDESKERKEFDGNSEKSDDDGSRSSGERAASQYTVTSDSTFVQQSLPTEHY